MLSPCDLDLGPTSTNVSNGTSTYDGEQLRKFILKSIQNCSSYDPDKNLTFKCDLDLGPTWINVSNGTSTHDREQLCQIILKSIHNCRSYGPDKLGRTHAYRHVRTHIHRTVIVSTMSHSPQADSTTKFKLFSNLIFHTLSYVCLVFRAGLFHLAHGLFITRRVAITKTVTERNIFLGVHVGICRGGRKSSIVSTIWTTFLLLSDLWSKLPAVPFHRGCLRLVWSGRLSHFQLTVFSTSSSTFSRKQFLWYFSLTWSVRNIWWCHVI